MLETRQIKIPAALQQFVSVVIIFLIVEVVGTWQGLFFGHSIDVENYKITPKATDHKVQLSMTA